LSAVSRILDSNDKIRSVCKKYKRQALINTDDDDDDDDEKSIYMEAGKRIITHYSDRASISGGLASLPSMIPGFGTAVSILGASAADVVLMLKFEFEMALCLCHLTGFDIEEERNRQLAFALAIASSRDILTNKNEPVQSKAIVTSAFWDYSVRQLSKHLIKNIAAILYMNLSKGMVKALPFVGVAVGASFNKVMTKRTGLCCLDALWLRRHIAISSWQDDEDDTVYDAEILD
ncbi:MAG: hypothetical protein J6A01_11285, partial [Proteobacteria bacterium]|nr:hypothetical protein [Pseudomonadota bacterium]